MTVEYFQDTAGEWRYRIKGGNGEIMATSEGYTRRENAVRGFADLRTGFAAISYAEQDATVEGRDA